ncbi:unnamed protein product [Colias eurytheme]|nr:unnamed protein product [Colias eurytheme]
MDVEAVVGRTASLPCDIEPDSHEDRVYMVLWFRHAGGKPLYRANEACYKMDYRQPTLTSPTNDRPSYMLNCHMLQHLT